MTNRHHKPGLKIPAGIQAALFVVAVYSFSYSQQAAAWDSVGHRISAIVAIEFLDAEVTHQLMEILSAHPRFQEDFVSEIPRFIDRDDQDAINRWLLGQAAFWPDIARGLPDAERERFNRPWWHYADGAWVRGSAMSQGNLYVGVPEAALTPGEAASSIVAEDDVSNVLTGIDYNARVLTDPEQPAAQRAVALCWVLHLMGDIHQPLHAGSLFSAALFDSGDRGGNGIPIGESNLHAVWDSALASGGVDAEVPLTVNAVNAAAPSELEGIESDWTLWLDESRTILSASVYPPSVIAAIRESDSNGTQLGSQNLSDSYVEQMRDIARQRLGLAGYRLAIFFTNELPH